MKIDTMLTPAVVRIARSASVEAAARLMRERHVGALLVIDDTPNERRLAGIVTDRDIVLRGVAENLAPRQGTVAQVMTPNIVTIAPGTRVREALDLMRSRGVRRLLVVHPDGTPAGVLSLDDIVDAFGRELGGAGGILRSELEHEMARALIPA